MGPISIRLYESRSYGSNCSCISCTKIRPVLNAIEALEEGRPVKITVSLMRKCRNADLRTALVEAICLKAASSIGSSNSSDGDKNGHENSTETG